MDNASEISRYVYRPQDVRELDRIAIEEQGIPGYELMCRAGRVAYAAMRERYSNAERWLILCGSGNNAGDGYVIARLAIEEGLDVRVVSLSPPAKLMGDAATAWQDLQAVDRRVQAWDGPHSLGDADLIIDALLGTGLMRPLAGAYLESVVAVREFKARNSVPVIAVDIATGLNGLTGEVMGAAIEADLTVTFVGLKQGLFLGAGPNYSGDIVFADLGIAPVNTRRIRATQPKFGRDV